VHTEVSRSLIDYFFYQIKPISTIDDHTTVDDADFPPPPPLEPYV